MIKVEVNDNEVKVHSKGFEKDLAASVFWPQQHLQGGSHR